MKLNPHLVEELRLKSSQELKKNLPMYPVVRRSGDIKVVFSTLVRKRYDGMYYLIPMKFEDSNEAKCIHGLHSSVYKYLMLGKLNMMDVLDDNQEDECNRLENTK